MEHSHRVGEPFSERRLNGDRAVLSLATLVALYIAGLGDDGPYLFDQERRSRVRPADTGVAVVVIALIDLARELVWSETVMPGASAIGSANELLDLVDSDLARLLQGFRIVDRGPEIPLEQVSGRAAEAMTFAGTLIATELSHRS